VSDGYARFLCILVTLREVIFSESVGVWRAFEEDKEGGAGDRLALCVGWMLANRAL
jgi:hypothetical protein